MFRIGLPHLLKRKTYTEPVDPAYESFARRFWKAMLDDVMYVVAVLAPFVLIPQALEIYRNKDAGGLSLITWVLLALINVLWVAYASVHRERPVFISSLFSGLIQLVIVIGIVMYG